MIDPAVIDAQLRAKAREFLDLSARLAALASDDPRVAKLRRSASQAFAAADSDRADAALADAERLDREEAEAQLNVAHILLNSAAETRAVRAAAARLRLDHLAAAEHFGEAARIVTPLGDATRFRYSAEEAASLGDHGYERGDGEALRLAIQRYRAVLTETFRCAYPDDWAATQDNLGNVLATVAVRESGTARLEEAVAAYSAALEEWTRERVPLDWAATQNNLGNALAALGERETGTARLEEAVAAYRAALEERTRERVPLDWAHSQHNLSLALEALGERNDDKGVLAEAVRCITDAAEVYRDGGMGYWLPVAEESLARMQGKLAAITAAAPSESTGNSVG